MTEKPSCGTCKHYKGELALCQFAGKERVSFSVFGKNCEQWLKPEENDDAKADYRSGSRED